MITKLSLLALAAPLLALALPESGTDAAGDQTPEAPSILETISEVTWEEFEAAAL